MGQIPVQYKELMFDKMFLYSCTYLHTLQVCQKKKNGTRPYGQLEQLEKGEVGEKTDAQQHGCGCCAMSVAAGGLTVL